MGQWFPFLTDEFLIIMSRVMMAAILCGLVGFEREINKHPAGFRTHLLVGVGSCIMMLLSLYGFRPYISEYPNIQFDPSRIPSYVISGIGFLGAGTILVKGATVRGLTTAASIWVVAGLGLIIGVGMYATAVFSTIVVLMSLNLLNRIDTKSKRSRKITEIKIVVKKNKHCLSQVVKLIQEHSIVINNLCVEDYDEIIEEGFKQYTIELVLSDINKKASIIDHLFEVKGIVQIS